MEDLSKEIGAVPKKFTLEKTFLAVLLTCTIAGASFMVNGCSTNENNLENEGFAVYTLDGEHQEGDTKIFEPNQHIITFSFPAMPNDQQINCPEGYELDQVYFTYNGNNGYTNRAVFMNTQMVEAVASYNENTKTVEFWQPGTPIQMDLENENNLEDETQKTSSR